MKKVYLVAIIIICAIVFAPLKLQAHYTKGGADGAGGSGGSSTSSSEETSTGGAGGTGESSTSSSEEISTDEFDPGKLIQSDNYDPNKQEQTPTKLTEFAGKILGALTAIGVIITVIVIAVIGFTYITGSAGDIAEIMSRLGGILIGVVLLTGATAIVRLVLNVI